MSVFRRACALFFSLLLVVPAQAWQATGSASSSAAGAPSGTATSPSTQNKAARPWTHYCYPAGGFCFSYPGGWKMLGPIFGGAGVVVAEPSPQRPEAEWNQITAASLEMPEPAEGTERPELNDLVNHVISPPEGAAIHIVQRTATVIAGYPAQLVTTQIQERGKPDVVEQVAFIDAGSVIYTLAVRSATSDFKRLQPLFLRALKSWRETAPAAASGTRQEPAPPAGVNANPGNINSKPK